MNTIVETITPRTRRNVELVLLLLAVGITLLAWVSVDLGVRETVPAQLVTVGGGLLGLVLAFHLVLRWRASYADPLLLPIATLLNGFGLVMIHRLDLAGGRTGIDSDAGRQLVWTGLSVVIAAVFIVRRARPPAAAPAHLHRHGHRPRPAPAAPRPRPGHDDLRLPHLDPARPAVVPAR